MHLVHPGSRPRHDALGLGPADLDILVVEPSRTLQSVLRSMLQPLRPRRLRFADGAAAALGAAALERPNLILTEWRMRPMSGLRFLRTLRRQEAAPLCFVPVLVLTGQASRPAVEQAFRAGAQAVLARPLSPQTLSRRLEWLQHDDRPFRLAGDHWVVDGVADLLDAQRRRERLPTPEPGHWLEEAEPPAAPSPAAAGGEDAPPPSPTLQRLVRQRAAEAAGARSGRHRWADIWN